MATELPAVMADLREVTADLRAVMEEAAVEAAVEEEAKATVKEEWAKTTCHRHKKFSENLTRTAMDW